MAVEPNLAELISLRGKTAVITGAAAGMGKAIAHRFAEAGAQLLLIDIDAPNLTHLQHELGSRGVDVSCHTLDLAEKAQIDRFWNEIGARVPDILVNNAGVFPFRDFLQTDEAFVERVMNINLMAAYWMCQHFTRRFLASDKENGAIVNISSIEAQLPFKEDLAHYTIGKAGVISLTRALSRDYGSRGIRANVVLPGAVNTPGTQKARKEVLRNPGLLKDGLYFRQRLSLGRWGEPDEVARIVLVLASDLASYMNGAVVPVDGGFLSS